MSSDSRCASRPAKLMAYMLFSVLKCTKIKVQPCHVCADRGVPKVLLPFFRFQLRVRVSRVTNWRARTGVFHGVPIFDVIVE